MTFTGYDLPFNEGAIGDLNHDGFLDMQYGSNIYLNTPNSNNWMTVELQGLQSNGNGIGARVEIYGAWGKQIREIKSGNGFSHQSSLNAHFGIGAATAIDKIIVRWPSGLVDTVNNPTINTPRRITEGTTLGITSLNNSGFGIYPNPVRQLLNIKTDNNSKMESAQIYDLNGRLVFKAILTNTSIAVDTLHAGTYILLLRDINGKDHLQKFIKI